MIACMVTDPGGDSHMKRLGMLIGNQFVLTPNR